MLEPSWNSDQSPYLEFRTLTQSCCWPDAKAQIHLPIKAVLNFDELGLSLLSHASLPLSFWDHAFVTAVYLINRLPSAPLNFYTPYDVLFCSILFLITHSLKSLAELAILFCILITLTSLNFAPLSVSSLDIPPVLKGTSVCLPLVVFLSPKMFSLMNSSFPILNCFLLHLPLQLHQHPYLSPPL